MAIRGNCLDYLTFKSFIQTQLENKDKASMYVC